MSSQNPVIAILAAGALALGCNGTTDGTADEPALEDIPSQEELDAQAADEIDESNADEAFEELAAEIEEDE